MTRRHGAGLPVLAICVLLLLLTGCQVSALQFRNDDRLHFTSPHSRALVKAPFTVSWSMKDFTATGLDGFTGSHSGAYAVFVDRAPMPVGRNLKWLARNDAGCKRDPRCPDAAYLSDRGVYVTTHTSITLDQLPAAPDGVGDEQHYVNVILIDGTGHRIGESAWYLPFHSKRRSSS